MIIHSPCRFCEARKLGCHGSCEKYKEYKDKTESIALAIRNCKTKNGYPKNRYI